MKKGLFDYLMENEYNFKSRKSLYFEEKRDSVNDYEVSISDEKIEVIVYIRKNIYNGEIIYHGYYINEMFGRSGEREENLFLFLDRICDFKNLD